MARVYYITYVNGFLVLNHSGGSSALTIEDINDLSRCGACVFADLEDIAVIIMGFLRKRGVSFRFFGVRLNTHYIRVGRLVIKNSVMFNLDLGKSYGDVCADVFQVKLLVMDCLGLPIWDKRVNGLSSVSGLLLKKSCSFAIKKTDAYDALFRSSYFGGRKESFSSASHLIVYDFPSMYSNIQLGLYPKNYRESEYGGDFSAAGFYRINFSYRGGLLSPRLPVRQANGSVLYASEGSGLYWNEEILQFKKCGGSVCFDGYFLGAFDNGAYLENVNRYLQKKRAEGYKAAKSVANSIYGRMAINPSNTTTKFKGVDISDFESVLSYKRFKSHDGYILYEEHDSAAGLDVERNLGWASIVTSRGRSQLMELMYACEVLGHKMCFVNTDSVGLQSSQELYVGDKLFKRLRA